MTDSHFYHWCDRVGLPLVGQPPRPMPAGWAPHHLGRPMSLEVTETRGGGRRGRAQVLHFVLTAVWSSGAAPTTWRVTTGAGERPMLLMWASRLCAGLGLVSSPQHGPQTVYRWERRLTQPPSLDSGGRAPAALPARLRGRCLYNPVY